MTTDHRTRVLKPVHLASLTMAESERLFDTLPSPLPNALDGVYRGRLTSARGLQALPWTLRRLIAEPLTRARFPWYGKQFKNGEGANVWLTGSGRALWGRYRVVATGERVGLSYDVPANPAALRPMGAQIRELAPGRFLARMEYRAEPVLYFTLEA